MSWKFTAPSPQAFCSQVEGRGSFQKFHGSLGLMKNSVSNSTYSGRASCGVRCYQLVNGVYRVIYQRNIDGEPDMPWTPYD